MTNATSSPKRFILVDGNALIYRAFHALPPLTTKTGELVNAVYGFTTLLLKAIHDIDPDYAAVTFDVGKTFRHEQYKEYKATRAKTPDELKQQFGRVRDIVASLNIPIFTAEGFEADDVIGTLSVQAKEHGIETIIVTGDMDTLQLVNPLVKVYTARKSLTDTVLYDEAAVRDRYGLTPNAFVDFKALKGDASDNIPGVDGIGEKTASTLIQAFDSLDKLYEFLETKDLAEAPTKITPRIKEILLKGKEQAYQSQYLSRIVCDVPVKLDLEAAMLKDYDRQKTVELFQELDFRSLLTKLPETGEATEPDSKAKTKPAKVKEVNKQQASLFADPETTEAAERFESQVKDKKYHLVNTEKSLDEMLAKLTKAKQLVVDTETDFLNGPIIGFSFAIKAGEAWYVPVGTKEKPNDCVDKLSRQQVLEKLRPLLENETIEKIGHNIKYDYLAIRREGITLQPLSFDTMIASYMLNPNSRAHGLDAVAFSELGIEMIPIAQLIGVKKLDSLATVEVEKVAEYAAEDADIEWRLYEIFAPQIAKADYLKKVFFEIELPLIPILGEMELRGIQVDCDYLADLSKRLSKRQTELIAQIYDHAGQTFNINSTQQLAVILFDKLQLTHPDMKKTKTGFSTAASELEKLRGMHPIVDLLFEYRELSKLLSTYIDTLPGEADDQSRIHTSYNQIGAATGRLSSNDPNLQNIPIRTELGREIRKAFIGGKGKKLLSVDYSQIELRVVAHLASDTSLIKAFADGRDIHQEVADALGVDRRVGKTLNFAVLYGQGAYSTAYQLGVNMAQAREYIQQYFTTYAGVRSYLDESLAQAKKLGYAETIAGRRRYIPEITSSNFAVRSGAERIATNMPIQGTAADIMKLAMIKIAASDIAEKHGATLLLQVHDELVFEVPSENVEAAAKQAKELMESAYKLKVPLLAEAKVGDNWGDMEKLEI